MNFTAEQRADAMSMAYGIMLAALTIYNFTYEPCGYFVPVNEDEAEELIGLLTYGYAIQQDNMVVCILRVSALSSKDAKAIVTHCVAVHNQDDRRDLMAIMLDNM